MIIRFPCKTDLWLRVEEVIWEFFPQDQSLIEGTNYVTNETYILSGTLSIQNPQGYATGQKIKDFFLNKQIK